MENTAFTGDDESAKSGKSSASTTPSGTPTTKRRDEKENGNTPAQIGIHLDGHIKAAKPQALKPYAGMNKEDLLRFSDTPFWNRLRLACLIIFWLIWLGLIAAIVTLTIVLPRCQDPPSQNWFQRSVFYQVYVRSFKDSNSDGSGDLKGVESQLGYLQGLNVEGLVLSSVLDSGAGSGAQVDVGYQVINYTNIDQLFGDLQDMDDLITAAHDRDLRVIMDCVPNFTGLNHPWFVASASATDSSDPFWNYYVWQDCGVGGATPPNNWRSVYDQDAWNLDATRGECYLAQFLPEQPDLNLNSPAVQAELEEVLRFWLRRGVDGFRVTNVAFLFENQDLTDDVYDPACGNTDQYSCYNHNNTRDRPEVHSIIARWKNVLNEFGSDKVLITDADTDLAETATYFSQLGAIGADLPLYYKLRDYSGRNGREIVQEIIQPWINAARGLGSTDWVLDNQDVTRVAFSDPDLSVPLTVLSLTLPGVPFLYYGQELGMVDGVNNNVDPADNYGYSRDPYRSPMQWNNQTDAGFTNGTSYLTVNPDYPTRNVETLSASPDSVLNKMKDLITLKRDSTTLQYGDTYFNTGATPPEVAAFLREYDGTDRFLVLVNLSGGEVTSNYQLTFGDLEVPETVTVTFNSAGSSGSEVSSSSIILDAYQSLVLSWEYTR